MFTAGLDGTDLREVIPFGLGVSHFEWRNDAEILATFRLDGNTVRHVLFTDGRRDYRAIGEGFLEGDGHPSFAPDQNRIVTDRNVAGKLEKRLMVYNIELGRACCWGRFGRALPHSE